jgi:hypothetical protein
MRPLYQRADFPSYRGSRSSYQRRVVYPVGKKWVETQGYLLGVCLKRCQLELHAGCLVFTHDHLDMGHPWRDDARVQARFSDLWEMFHYWIWRVLRANGWKHGPAYAPRERTYQGPTLDEEGMWHALCYDTAQAVKAGMVKRSSDYPGLVFLPKDVKEPRRFRRTSLLAGFEEEFPDEEVSIQLGIPRMFAHMTPDEYVREFEARLEAYEDEVGPERVRPLYQLERDLRALRPGTRLSEERERELTRGKPAPPDFTPGAAPVTCSDPELKLAYYRERTEFWDRHSEASDELRTQNTKPVFPVGTYGWRKRLNVPIEEPEQPCWAKRPLWMPD